MAPVPKDKDGNKDKDMSLIPQDRGWDLVCPQEIAHTGIMWFEQNFTEEYG